MQNLSRRLFNISAGLALALSGLSVHAADTSSPAPAAADKLAAARSQIAAKNWPAAIDELKKVNDTGSADWNNLMGYSQRKAKTPDYAAAEKYYDAALRIDPAHRGALEYSGELYLMTGNLPKAEERFHARQSVQATVRGVHRLEEVGGAFQGQRQQVRGAVIAQ